MNLIWTNKELYCATLEYMVYDMQQPKNKKVYRVTEILLTEKFIH